MSDQQVSALESRATRAESLIRQLQSMGGVAGPPGPAGPPGATGPQGPAGAGATTYVHTQTVLAATWTITHSLAGKTRPSVTVVDSGESVVLADVRYLSDSQVQIIFAAATSGKAYLN